MQLHLRQASETLQADARLPEVRGTSAARDLGKRAA